ncbi:MAG TPA: MFS transporter, partial [Lacipirellula sp.]
MSNPFLSDEREPSIRAQNSIAWIIWFTYGSFYFCRNNLSAAVPGMMRSVSEGGLGLDERQVGAILAALKITYAIGQLVNGQLAERISPRVLLALGMIGSAALNVAFGFSTAAYFLLFIWATNGYCQSLGWTPSVRVLANWIPVHRRGKALGFVGTGYQITGALTFIVAGQAAEQFGWRGAIFVPAAILLASAIVMLVLLEDAPEESCEANGGACAASATVDSSRELTLGRTLWLTFSNPLLWLLGVSLGLLDACRYGFTDWGLAHLAEVQDTGVGMAALKYAVLPAGGAAGAFAAGWASDR